MTTRIALPLLLLASTVCAQETSWDRIENIRQSAVEISSVQNEKGFFGAQAAVRNCYDDARRPGKTYGNDIEKCMTQDYLISHMAAQVYARVSPEARRLSNSQEPAAVLQGMSRRIVESVAHFKVPPEDAKEFIALIKEHGFSAFMNATER